MTKILWGLSMSLFILNANSLVLTAQQEEDWQIKSEMPRVSTSLPLGEFMAEVVTPPQLLHTITLPFEAQVKKFYVASYDKIKKGQLLAEVSGTAWIAIQEQFIEASIELKHQQQIVHRKNRLCREEIIPKKECIAANAQYKAFQSKVSASKTLLQGYGASSKSINRLTNRLKIVPNIDVYSKVSGKLLELNVQAGKSTLVSEPLFVILKEGALWLEMDILVQKAMRLKENQKVNIVFNEASFESRVLLHAPTINPENQTQKVRFSLPNTTKFLSGMKNPATIVEEKRTIKVAKKSVINLDGKEVVFVKTAKGYEPLEVEIVGEEEASYYLKDRSKLHAPIVVSSLLILKTLMEGEDE